MFSFVYPKAHFRGQRVRRRLAEALRAAHFYDDGDDEEEFDYDEEVDLTAFDFDESTLEHGWTPSDTPQMPSRYLFLVMITVMCGPVVRALALRSGDPGFKTRSDHSLNLFLVVPGSNSQLHL